MRNEHIQYPPHLLAPLMKMCIKIYIKFCFCEYYQNSHNPTVRDTYFDEIMCATVIDASVVNTLYNRTALNLQHLRIQKGGLSRVLAPL